MGQFNSKVFDGDSYIDLMRAVPEREVTWWVQKVIWIAQGYTALEHAGRAWPPLLLHRCAACDGHGALTCPHCRGAKLRSAAGRMRFLGPDPALMLAGAGAGDGQAGGSAALAAFGGAASSPAASAAAAARSASSPSSSSASPLLSGGGAAALAAALATSSPSDGRQGQGQGQADDDDEPCRHCGDFLPWDDEGGWADRWRAWERVASYYDRSLGPLMDEWHETAVEKKQRQVDSPEHDYFYGDDQAGPPAKGSPWDDGPSGRAAAERYGKGAASRLAAMLKRFGGHPYATGDVLPFDLIDPSKTTAENLWRVRALAAGEQGDEQGASLLPPELDPATAPSLARAMPGDLPPWDGSGRGGGGGDPSARAFLATPAELAAEIRAQAKLAQNLEAAARGGAKPHAFAAAAGTVPCPECQGAPWAWSWVPNFRTLMGSEPPPMLKAIWARSEDRARVVSAGRQLRAAGMAGGDGESGGELPARPLPLPDLPRPLLEYPSLAAVALPLDPVGRDAALSVLEGVAREGARQAEARRAAAAREAAARSPAAERRRVEAALPFSLRERALAGEDARGEADAAERALALEPHPLFGDSDPLSDDYAKATGGAGRRRTTAGAGGAGAGPAASAPADWPLRAAMPGRQAARQLRDARLLKALEREGDAEGKAALEGYLARRGRGGGAEA